MYIPDYLSIDAHIFIHAVRLYTDIYIHMCINTCMHAGACSCMCRCICIYMYIYIYIYIYMHLETCTCNLCIRIYTYIHTYIYIHIYIYIDICPCVYVCACMCICGRISVLGLVQFIWICTGVYQDRQMMSSAHPAFGQSRSTRGLVTAQAW